MLTKGEIRKVEQTVKAKKLYTSRNNAEDKERALKVVKDILLQGGGLRPALYALFLPDIGQLLRPGFYSDFDIDEPEVEFLELSISSLDSRECLLLCSELLTLSALFEKEKSMCSVFVLPVVYSILPSSECFEEYPDAYQLCIILTHLLDERVHNLVGGSGDGFSVSCAGLALLGTHILKAFEP